MLKKWEMMDDRTAQEKSDRNAGHKRIISETAEQGDRFMFEEEHLLFERDAKEWCLRGWKP